MAARQFSAVPMHTDIMQEIERAKSYDELKPHLETLSKWEGALDRIIAGMERPEKRGELKWMEAWNEVGLGHDSIFAKDRDFRKTSERSALTRELARGYLEIIQALSKTADSAIYGLLEKPRFGYHDLSVSSRLDSSTRPKASEAARLSHLTFESRAQDLLRRLEKARERFERIGKLQKLGEEYGLDRERTFLQNRLQLYNNILEMHRLISEYRANDNKDVSEAARQLSFALYKAPEARYDTDVNGHMTEARQRMLKILGTTPASTDANSTYQIARNLLQLVAEVNNIRALLRTSKR